MKKLLLLAVLITSALQADSVKVKRFIVILDKAVSDTIEIDGQKLKPVSRGMNIFNIDLEVPRLEDNSSNYSCNEIKKLKINNKAYGIFYTKNRGLLGVADFNKNGFCETIFISRPAKPDQSYDILLNLRDKNGKYGDLGPASTVDVFE